MLALTNMHTPPYCQLVLPSSLAQHATAARIRPLIYCSSVCSFAGFFGVSVKDGKGIVIVELAEGVCCCFCVRLWGRTPAYAVSSPLTSTC